MAMTPVVEVRELCKRYGDRTAVDQMNLDVHEGEIVGLLGTNGAGKTTTVECISGLRRPDSGSIRVLGMDPRSTARGFGRWSAASCRTRRYPTGCG